jgi:hypothetical protein
MKKYIGMLALILTVTLARSASAQYYNPGYVGGCNCDYGFYQGFNNFYPTYYPVNTFYGYGNPYYGNFNNGFYNQPFYGNTGSFWGGFAGGVVGTLLTGAYGNNFGGTYYGYGNYYYGF